MSSVFILQGRREMTAKVYCHGEGSCQISINSATTAGQVSHSYAHGLIGFKTIFWIIDDS